MTRESNRHPLPPSRNLVGSVIIAAGAAGVILIQLALPVEYEIDLTGMGRLLGLVPADERRAKALTFDPPMLPRTPVPSGP